MTDWSQTIRSGNRRALARLLTLLENNHEGIDATLADLYLHTGTAHRIGVTGAPGTGKSTLVTALAAAYRAQGQTVAILAIDPTSPFSGGAVLGDRIRMQTLSGDRGVFIRSMATRGSLGGLARTTQDAAHILDAAGFDRIVIETVGAGQSEIDVVRAAHTTLVVDAPGLGDGVQAIKAGILEIADLLIVNKADLPGAANTVRALQSMLDIGHPTKPTLSGHHGVPVPTDAPPPDTTVWQPPIIETVATEQRGLPTLLTSIDAHYQYLHDYNILAKQARQFAEADLMTRVADALLAEFRHQVPQAELDKLLDHIVSRQVSPRQAVQDALAARNQNLAT
jgi:LAO/AO transport system kinase